MLHVAGTGPPNPDAIAALRAAQTNALAIAFGNFQRGYLIVDRAGVGILRDPYTNKPYIGFYATKRVGGQVLNPEALRIQRVAA